MPQATPRDNAFLRPAADTVGDDETLTVPQWQPADWSTLFSFAELVAIPRGGKLIDKDGRERALYFVASGLLEVTNILGGKSTGASAIVHPGEVVGELAFLDGHPRSASVFAIADSELYRLQFDRFEAFAGAHADKAWQLLLALGRVVSMRLRHTEKQPEQP
jgi:CRP-like cAMP-binding protein